jgi:hypothetical protein
LRSSRTRDLIFDGFKYGAGTAREARNSKLEIENHVSIYFKTNGHAVAQAVSRWFPTVAARVRVRAEHIGFVVDSAALGQVFSEYFGFICQSSFHHHNHPGLAQ